MREERRGKEKQQLSGSISRNSMSNNIPLVILFFLFKVRITDKQYTKIVKTVTRLTWTHIQSLIKALLGLKFNLAKVCFFNGFCEK